LFSALFAFKPHSLVNIVGGGGKTALIHRLMEEYSASGPVLGTTTTRIHPPDAREKCVLIASENIPLLQLMIQRAACECAGLPYKLIVARSFMSPNLLRGVPPDFCDAVDRSLFAILLNEADGAAGYSIKIPGDGEPVPMRNAEYLVPVLGIDCLHRPLGPAVLFRFRELADRFSLREGDIITPELAAHILMHPRGVCKYWEPGSVILPFINKVDDPSQDADARNLASLILTNGSFPVTRVLFGSVLRGRIEPVSPSR
jgi:probable selenium-dependent hydroxylase accessory protein YqeC